MYPEQLHSDLRKWASDGLALMREQLALMKPVGTYQGWSKNEQHPIACLLSSCAQSAESAFLLIAYTQLWDAETQIRSVIEGTLKFAYILQYRRTFSRRLEEYEGSLFKIAQMKDHAKAQQLLSLLPDPRAPEWRPIRERLLTNEEVAKISADYPSRARRALETRWGFTGLIGELEGSGDPLFHGIAGLAFSYSTASHFLHMDSMGVYTSFERDMRSPERRDSVIRAHTLRLISDAFSAFWVRLQVGYRFVDADPGPIAEARRQYEHLETTFGAVFENWMAVEYGPETGSAT